MNCPQCGQMNQPEARSCIACGAAFSFAGSAAAGSLIGRMIDGRYRLEAELGTGGMGAVYLATRLHIGDQVAIKILHQHQDPSLQAAERFRREAQTMARLKHPNVVSIYDFGVTADGLQYLVMEWVEGESLRQRLKQQGALAPALVAETASQICEALSEAHERDIIHRDLKPDNIIVQQTPRGLRVKVLDFGIAKLRDQKAGHLTLTGHLVGTPYYMSPEQCLGEELDARSDIYSLGVVLYEMLCGQRPFHAPMASAVVVQHVNQLPPPLAPKNPEVTPAVEAVVRRALEKRPEHRQQTARELAHELTQAVNGAAAQNFQSQPAAFEKRTAPELTPDTGPTRVLSSGANPPFPRAVRRSNTGRTVALLLGALLLVVVSFLIVRQFLQSQKRASGSAGDALDSRVARNYANLKELRKYQHDMPVTHLLFSPNGEQLFVGGSRRINVDAGFSAALWKPQTGAVRGLENAESRDYGGHVNAVAFSPDGKTLVTSLGGYGSGGGTAEVWDVATAQRKQILKGSDAEYESGAYLLVMSRDGSLVAGLWDSGAQKALDVWRMPSGQLQRSFTLEGDTSWQLAFSPDGSLLACAIGTTIKVWSTQTWTELRALTGGSENVLQLEFSPDGALLAGLNNDGVIRLWDVKSWAVRQMLSGHSGKPHYFAFAPDGKTLASASQIVQEGETVRAEVRLWDVASGALKRAIESNAGLHYAERLTFAPDGQTLATGGWRTSVDTRDAEDNMSMKREDEELKLWEVQTGQLKREWSGMSAVAFSQDGAMVATGNDQGEVKLWQVVD